MTETEQELIEALRQHDRQAQRQVLEHYGREVFALLARMLTSREDAEEAYQDVFVKVFQGFGRYDEQRSSLRTWLSRLAYHEAIDRLRRKHHPVVYFDDYDADGLSDEEAAETLGQPNGETVQLIRTALQHLPPEGRAVTAADLLCNDNILLVFSQLKQQFLAGENTEFNAISVYSLCKQAREYGFFTNPNAKGELEQLKRDVALMKSRSADETLRNYLQMALDELEKIKE